MIIENIQNNNIVKENCILVEENVEKKCFEKNMTIKKNSWDNCTYGVN